MAGLAHGFQDRVGDLTRAVHVFEGDVAGFAEGFDGEVADADEALAKGLRDIDVADLIEDDVALDLGDKPVFEAENVFLQREAAGIEANVLHGGP